MSGIPAWAVPGAKVVCVDGANRTGIWVSGEEVVEGQRYTIIRAYIDFVGVVSCDLAEVVRAPAAKAFFGSDNVGYNLDRFRPLVSDSDDLGIETVLYRKAGLKSKSPVRTKERA